MQPLKSLTTSCGGAKGKKSKNHRLFLVHSWECKNKCTEDGERKEKKHDTCTREEAISEKTWCCEALGPKTWSKAISLSSLSWCTTTVRSEGCTSSRPHPDCSSSMLGGRRRTLTRMRDMPASEDAEEEEEDAVDTLRRRGGSTGACCCGCCCCCCCCELALETLLLRRRTEVTVLLAEEGDRTKRPLGDCERVLLRVLASVTERREAARAMRRTAAVGEVAGGEEAADPVDWVEIEARCVCVHVCMCVRVCACGHRREGAQAHKGREGETLSDGGGGAERTEEERCSLLRRTPTDTGAFLPLDGCRCRCCCSSSSSSRECRSGEVAPLLGALRSWKCRSIHAHRVADRQTKRRATGAARVGEGVRG